MFRLEKFLIDNEITYKKKYCFFEIINCYTNDVLRIYKYYSSDCDYLYAYEFPNISKTCSIVNYSYLVNIVIRNFCCDCFSFG